MQQRKDELNYIYKDYQKQKKLDVGVIQRLGYLWKAIGALDDEFNQEMAQIEMATYIHDRTYKDLM
jgi:hypothetical protein